MPAPRSICFLLMYAAAGGFAGALARRFRVFWDGPVTAIARCAAATPSDPRAHAKNHR
jgi:hypothetical protein